MNSGVYCILNLVNRKRYVGSAKTMRLRVGGHRRLLRINKHANVHLQRAWNKYGEENFAIFCLERCPPEDCVGREQHFIDLYKSANRVYGYNISPTAGSALGVKHTAKVVRGMRERSLKWWSSPGSKEMMSDLRKRTLANPETRRKMSESAKRRFTTPKGKALAKRCGKLLVEYNRSEESRKRVSLHSSKRRWSAEVKEKIRKAVAASWLRANKRRKATSERMRKFASSPEERKRRSEHMRRLHQDKKWEKRVLQMSIEARGICK